eukprot:gene15765-17356_t
MSSEGFGFRGTKRAIIICVFLSLLLLVIGAFIGVGIKIAIGCSSSGSSSGKSNAAKKSMQEMTKEAFKQHPKILGEMKANNIRDNLEFLTKNPHIAGSEESKKQAMHVAKKLREYGFDKVKIHPYNILLSYPMKPGQVNMTNGTLIHKFNVIEPIITPDENISKIVYPFNAYSPAKDVTGELVYANYGRSRDFAVLENARISVKGKIVIMRYGPTSRGAKVANAQAKGAAGVLLFSDPKEWNPQGKSDSYPDGWGLPDTGIQRGTIIRRQGDALSREYPSKAGFYRADISKATPLPQIPSQPIQFNDAKVLLSHMDGMDGPASFQGAAGFTYKMNATSYKKVGLTVHTKLESRMTYTVSAMIYGKVEPDRMVLLGNHRDSWVYGAGDASSGQAAMLEIARSLGALKKKGWRPRRSIMVCSWDAEEYGIHGSTEWVEEHQSILRERAVAYLNVDIAVEGNYTVRLRGTPELDNAFFDATKKVPAPDANTNLFEDWLKKNRNPSAPSEPKTIVATSGSDYKPFYHTIGISCVDLRYMFAKLPGTTYPYMYPMYHSLHDTFRWMTKFVDPDYRYHLTTGKMWASLGLILADSLVLPFNLSRAADKVSYYASKFDKDHKQYLSPQNISTELLVKAADNLTKAVANFEQELKGLDREDSLKVRMANDRIMSFQRQFVHQTGLMGRDDLRNVVYATRSGIMVSGNKFTAIGQAIKRAYDGKDKDWDEVKRQIMIAVFHLQEAAQSYESLKVK